MTSFLKVTQNLSTQLSLLRQTQQLHQSLSSFVSIGLLFFQVNILRIFCETQKEKKKNYQRYPSSDAFNELIIMIIMFVRMSIIVVDRDEEQVLKLFIAFFLFIKLNSHFKNSIKRKCDNMPKRKITFQKANGNCFPGFRRKLTKKLFVTLNGDFFFFFFN